MSIHVELSNEARAALERQRKRTTISSLFIALLAITLVLLMLALFALAPVLREIPTIVGYTAPVTEATDEPDIRRPVTQTHQARPSAPASMGGSARAIVSQSASNIAIEVPTMEVESVSIDFGSGDGLAKASGSVRDFLMGVSELDQAWASGSTQRLASALRGTFYDFKQTKKKEPNRSYNAGRYGSIIDDIHRRKFRDTAFSDFYQAPQQLNLTQIAIPGTRAEEGPKFFGVENEVEPAGWLVHYTGQVSVSESGTYRFVAAADDYLSVMVDGKLVLMAARPDLKNVMNERWKPSDNVEKWSSTIGDNNLVFGDWVDFDAAQAVQFDVSIGERPGGLVGFIMLVEKKDERYKKDDKDRPILPLFTTAAFSKDVEKEITGLFPRLEMEWKKVPVFYAK